jgi:hypothetical protein
MGRVHKGVPALEPEAIHGVAPSPPNFDPVDTDMTVDGVDSDDDVLGPMRTRSSSVNSIAFDAPQEAPPKIWASEHEDPPCPGSPELRPPDMLTVPRRNGTSLRSTASPDGSALNHSKEVGGLLRRPKSYGGDGGRMSLFSEGGFLGMGSTKSGPRQSVFADAEKMKEELRERIFEKEIADYYADSGVFQHIVRHPVFECVTMTVIALNSIWIAVDTDLNKADFLFQAPLVFQVVENAFCVFFIVEVFIRFNAFESRRHCMKDSWLLFDILVVSMMMLEIWVLNGLSALYGREWEDDRSRGLLNISGLARLGRLCKLVRMGKMLRLLKTVPEIMIMVRGLVAAFRSVVLTLILLCGALYVFAIVLTQLYADHPAGSAFFGSVPRSMRTLWVYGTLLDEITQLMAVAEEIDYLCVAILDLFILIGALTLMNMLIGVMCDVILAVASSEKDEMFLHNAKIKLEEIFHEHIDADDSGTINQSEFVAMLNNDCAANALHDLGVDVVGLVDIADIIFDEALETGQESRKQLQFAEFTEVVVRYKNSNGATVKDIMGLHRIINKVLDKVSHMARMQEKEREMKRKIQRMSSDKWRVGVDDNWSEPHRHVLFSPDLSEARRSLAIAAPLRNDRQDRVAPVTMPMLSDGSGPDSDDEPPLRRHADGSDISEV